VLCRFRERGARIESALDLGLPATSTASEAIVEREPRGSACAPRERRNGRCSRALVVCLPATETGFGEERAGCL
jgi:hypothetical protein